MLYCRSRPTDDQLLLLFNVFICNAFRKKHTHKTLQKKTISSLLVMLPVLDVATFVRHLPASCTAADRHRSSPIVDDRACHITALQRMPSRQSSQIR